MKRYGNLYEKICTMENLQQAHKNAKKDKSHYRGVKMVDSNPDYYLGIILNLLKKETYEVSEYKISKIMDKGKERELYKSPYFPDRIIQWAILLQIEFIFLEVMTDFTCASLKNRGIHKASRLLDSYMRDTEGTQYCLKIDVKKFYPNIDHKVLKGLLIRKIKDQKVLDLLYKVIDSIPGDKGIPIGSYLSQYFANFYLAYFDHWLKESMKIRYVIRYMDDVVILHSSKLFLHELTVEIMHYLDSELKLMLKSTYQVFPTAIRGIDFVGYRHFYGYKLLRKTTCKNFKRKMGRLKKKLTTGGSLTNSDRCSIQSYKGWLNWCDSYRLQIKYLITEGL